MALIHRRTRRATPDPVVQSDLSGPLTAAATAIPAEKWGKIGKTSAGRTDWQAEAWDMLDLVGELRAAIEWKAGLLSRFRLIASDLDPDTGQPTGETENQFAKEIVARIAGGAVGQTQMLRRLAVLLGVPGEGYLAIIFPNGEEQWHILSREEIKPASGDVEIQLPDGEKYQLNDLTDSLSRIHMPHPRWTWEADSPVRAALPILREIVRMTQNIEAAGKSRVAGNGILMLPDEISMPSATAPRAQTDPDAPTLPAPPAPPVQRVTSDQIRVALQTIMAAAIKDQTSAEALVPLILQMKGEWIDKVRHLTLASEITEQSRITRQEAVRRLALALDMPPEALLGMGDTNHWSIYGIEDQALRWYSSDDIETICDAFTTQLLWPMLPEGSERNVVVWYEVDDVEADPLRDQKLQGAYDRGLLNSDSYLTKGLGLDDVDGYDLRTLTGWQSWAADAIRRKPELLPTLVPLLAIPGLELAPAPASEPAPADAAPSAELPAPGAGETAPNAAAAVLIRMCIDRALELAANRRRNRSNIERLRNVAVKDTHTVLGPVDRHDVGRLIDGWSAMLDEQFCRGVGLSMRQVETMVRDSATATLTGKVRRG